MTACMGGWCDLRGACEHYKRGKGEPVERLCPKAGTIYFYPREKDRVVNQQQQGQQ